MTNNMYNVYSIMEMENIFEIGRTIEAMIRSEEIEIENSKDAFALALKLAIDFEKEYPDTEDYYNDLDEYVMDKIVEEFGVEV